MPEREADHPFAHEPHLRWGAEALWQRLAPVLPGISVEVVARLESTNTRLVDRARRASGDPDAPVTRPGTIDTLEARGATPHGRRADDLRPCLLVAEHQTRGRGRLGRTWQASPGASLTFSLALPYAPADWSGLSLAVGLAIAEALDPPAEDGRAPRVWLKWPNDLWLVTPGEGTGGRKLGGILIETVSVGRHRMCVVGVGLNVKPIVVAPPEGAAAPLAVVDSASVAEFEPGLGAPDALARIALPLAECLVAFEKNGFAALAARYAARDVLRGRPVELSAGPVPRGVAEGVDDSGALRVQAGDALHRIVSGEVSVRPRTAALPPEAPGSAPPGEGA